MLSDKERGYLTDIIQYIELADKFTQDQSYETFVADDRTVLAVIRCLEVISEASRRLPDFFKTQHSKIEWQDMAAAGNVYRHDYSGVTTQRIWTTLKESLPPLKQIALAELAKPQ